MTGRRQLIRAFWEQAFDGRDLDLLDAITALGFVRQFGVQLGASDR
jgi:hypothetical protein